MSSPHLLMQVIHSRILRHCLELHRVALAEDVRQRLPGPQSLLETPNLKDSLSSRHTVDVTVCGQPDLAGQKEDPLVLAIVVEGEDALSGIELRHPAGPLKKER